MNIKEQTYYLIADRVIGKSDSKIYVVWAVDMIQRGHETENILILAGLDSSDTEEREKYFRESLNDLKIEYPDNKSRLISLYSTNLADKVLTGKISPQIGLTKMIELVYATDYSSEFLAFVDLDEDIDYVKYSSQPLFNSGLTKNNIDEFIINEFKLFLETIEFKDEVLRNKAKCKKCGAIENPVVKSKWSWKELRNQNNYCCPKCFSQQLIYGNSQKGKRLIIDELKKTTPKIL